MGGQACTNLEQALEVARRVDELAKEVDEHMQELLDVLEQCPKVAIYFPRGYQNPFLPYYFNDLP